jgi:hypothetical protein
MARLYISPRLWRPQLVLGLRSPRRYRSHATVAPSARVDAPGDGAHGFTLQKKERFDVFHLTAYLLRHDKTGAEYLHLARDDDPNKVFAISFRTNPPDATGVPHILEHSTLCGSEKFVL